ncbi:unnamed protein product [Camellia sinensis]
MTHESWSRRSYCGGVDRRRRGSLGGNAEQAEEISCFLCYAVPSSLYNACLGMLNLRCLSIVFDLDETLIVANTMKSFEDRIEALRSWIAHETDPIRMSGMTAEMKQYVDDRALLNFKISLDTSQRIFKISLDSPNPEKFSDKYFQRFSHPENFSGLHNPEKIPRQIFPEKFSQPREFL